MGGTFKLFDVGGVVAIAGIGVTLLIFIARNNGRFIGAEPMPRPGKDKDDLVVAADERGPRRSAGRRWVVFNVVGAMGFANNLGLSWMLTAVWRVNGLAATLIGGGNRGPPQLPLALRRGPGRTATSPRGEIARRLVRFNLTTGVASIAGNVVVTAALVRLCGIHYLALMSSRSPSVPARTFS